MPFVPIASAVVSFALMLSLPGATWERLAIWMAAGFVIYFFYSRRRSLLAV
jgi:APA family basic amino acid/polyamine antiporter